MNVVLAITTSSSRTWALAAIGPEGLVAHAAGPASLDRHAGPDVLPTLRIVAGEVHGRIDLLLVVVDDDDPETTSLLLQLHHGDALRVVGVASVTSAEVLRAIGLRPDGHQRAPHGDPVLVRAVARAAEMPLADTQVAEAWAVAALYASRDQRFLTSPLLDWGSRLPDPLRKSGCPRWKPSQQGQ